MAKLTDEQNVRHLFPRETYEILPEFEGGKRLHSVPLRSLSHRKWFCFSSAAKTMGISRYTGRWKEERASAVTAVTPVILLYAGNKCAPLTHASAIPALSSILDLARLSTCSLEESPDVARASKKKREKEGKSMICDSF